MMPRSTMGTGSAEQDRYIPIPEADPAAKCRLIRQGQAYRKCRVDPADMPDRTAGQDRPPSMMHRMTGLRLHRKDMAYDR